MDNHDNYPPGISEIPDDTPFPTEADFDAALDTPAPATNTLERARTQLDQLATLRADAEELTIRREAEIRATIPDEIRARLQAIENTYDHQFQAIKGEMDRLEAEIKAAALAAGSSTKGQSGMQVIFSAGRVTWDTKGLTRYAKKHPEIDAFRVEGEPYVTIKRA